MNNCGIVNITEQIKEKTIALRRSYKMRLPDCIIAATSEYLALPLMTADSDLKKIEEINVVYYNIVEQLGIDNDNKPLA